MGGRGNLLLEWAASPAPWARSYLCRLVVRFLAPPMPLYLVRSTDGGLTLPRLIRRNSPRTRESHWFISVFARKLTCKPGRRPFNYFYGADFARKPYVRDRRQRVCT